MSQSGIKGLRVVIFNLIQIREKFFYSKKIQYNDNFEIQSKFYQQ